MNNIELSVVVLGYRAGINLEPFINELSGYLEKEAIDYQIVLVGNYWPGIEDVTPVVVRGLADKNKRIKPVIMPKQGAMGWDMRSGLNAADGKLVAVIDGDGQMPPFDVVRVYRKMKEDGCDMVKTFRTQRMDDRWRTIVSFCYNGLFRLMFPGFLVRDVNSKPKILTRDLFNVLDLRSDDWFADAEIMIQARRYGAKVSEIPTVFRENDKRPSFVKAKTILEFAGNLFKARIYEYFNYGRGREDRKGTGSRSC